MPQTIPTTARIFLDTPPDGSLNWKMGKIKKFILTTAVYEMLTEKDHYNELKIIHIEHNYSSAADSDLYYGSNARLPSEALPGWPHTK